MFTIASGIVGQTRYFFFLKANLTWVPHKNLRDNIGKGVFQIHRLLQKNAAIFPSGYKTVVSNFKQLSEKIRSRPETVKFGNFRLEIEFKKGWYKKFTPQELANELSRLDIKPPGGIYLDLHSTYNEKSSSTPFRLLVDPARPRRLLGDTEVRQSYNDLVTIPKYGLITPFHFSVRQMLYTGVIGMDISTAFRTIKHSDATMLHNLTVFYEGNDGQPLLTPEGAKVVNGEPLITTYAFANLLFGIKDSPSLLGLALSQAVIAWEKHEDPEIKKRFVPWILLKVTDLLTRPYVDDLLVGALPYEVIEHLINSCSVCSWCEECKKSTLQKERKPVHNDFCPLYVEKEKLKHSLCEEKRECECKMCPLCKTWQQWVRPGKGGVVVFQSAHEYNKYLKWFHQEYLKYMCLVLEYLLKILTFSGFTTKGIETQFTQLKETYDRFKPSTTAQSDNLWAPVPDVQGVKSESQKLTLTKNEKKKAWKPGSSLTTPPELKWVISQSIVNFSHKESSSTSEREQKEFMTQMARIISSVPNTAYNDSIRCRSDSIEIINLKLYKNSGPLNTYEEFVDYIRKHDFVITRRFVASFTGLLFDVGHMTTNMLVPLVFIKRAHHHLYLLPGVNVPNEDFLQEEGLPGGKEPKVKVQSKAQMPDWDSPVPTLCRLLLFKSAQAFYLLKDRKVPRNNIIQHCATGRMIIAMADSGTELSAERIFLVTYFYVNGLYTAQHQCVHNLILINRPDLLSMPVKEGIALYRLTISLADVLNTLGDMGLSVNSDHVSLVTDSHTTLILLRSISSYGIFQNKLKHLAAKTYAVLVSLQINVMRSLYSFDQDNKEGILFPPDLLTKASENMTPKAMLDRADNILNLPWLNWHPSRWPISRKIRESQAASFIGGDLLIDPAYMKRLQEEVRYQKEVCVGTVAEPLKLSSTYNFGLPVLSKQARHTMTSELTPHEERKAFFAELIKHRFSNILYEDSRSKQFRKVSLIGVLSLATFWIARVRLKAKLRKNKTVSEERRATSAKSKDITRSRWCGFLLCMDEMRCHHPTSDFGGRLKDGEGGLYVRQDQPHKIYHDNKIWGLSSKDSDSLFAQPTPDLGLKSTFQGCTTVLQERICCTNTDCVMCTTDTHIVTIHDFLGYITENMQQPADGVTHWKWAQQCVQLTAHFAFHPLFRMILSERVLDLLAAVFPAKEPMIDGMVLDQTKFETGFWLSVANSREIRDFRQVNCPQIMGRVMWRGISSKSHLAVSLICQLHSGTHHVGTYAVRFKLLNLGLLCNSVHKIATEAAANCQMCYLDKIRRGRPSELPKQKERIGPFDLATITNLSKGAPPTMFCGDSVGPIKIICPCKAKNVVQVHVMVWVDVFTLRVRYHILHDMTTKEVWRDLVELVSEVGPIEALVFDPSSIFKHFASTMGPIETPHDEDMKTILKRLNKRQGTKLWTRILQDQYVHNKLPPRVHVKISPTSGSWIQGRCEEKVKHLKLTLSQHKIFGLNISPTITLSDLQLHLSIIADVHNNMPSLSIGHRIFLSPNDLSSMAGRIGMGQTNFPNILEGGGQDGPELLKSIHETSRLASIIRSSIWSLYLTRLQRNTTWKKDARYGTPTDLITRGSICVDLKRVNQYKTIHQSMGRVELLSKGKRWVLLSLVVPQSIDINLRRELFSCSAHQIVGCEPCVRKVLKQSPTACQLVTRHITHIYPIFNPESEKIDSFCPRWIFPSLWHVTKNDFSGGLFLHDHIDQDVLHKYEKELQELEEKEEKIEKEEIVTQGSP